MVSYMGRKFKREHRRIRHTDIPYTPTTTISTPHSAISKKKKKHAPNPYTLRSGPTTPPCASGSITHVAAGWYCVPAPPCTSHASMSASACTPGPGAVSAPSSPDLARELDALAHDDDVYTQRERERASR
jgi:hypothetical protein